jgi:hypothetical protein
VIPAKPPGPHPDAESLFRAHAAPKAAGSAEVFAHAATCAACSTELAALDAFSANPPDPFGGAPRRAEEAWQRFAGRPARRPARIPMPALAIAAAVVLLAGAALLVRRPATDVLRGGEITRGGLFPAGVIPGPPAEFRFPAGGAARVQVSVFDAERRYVWTSPPFPAGVAVPFPPEERAKLRPGVAYSWVVLGESSPLPSQSFEIRPAKER